MKLDIPYTVLQLKPVTLPELLAKSKQLDQMNALRLIVDIVFDADKLDSLGAAGIGRAFLFAGRENARLHNTAAEALAAEAYSKEDTAYREYLVKLRYLPRKMRSEAGRKIAVERAAFMADFFERLDKETKLGDFSL